MPRRSSATVAGSKPRPVSRTKPVSSASSASTNTSTRSTSAWRAALTSASRTAATSARDGVVERLVADDDGLDADVVVGLDLDGQGVDRGVQRRRFALVRRRRTATPAARAPGAGRGVAIRRGSSVRWISTSDCSTESWRWAATVARSSSRMRAARSSSSRRSRRPSAGAANIASPPTTTAMALGRRADVAEPAGAAGERDHAGDEQRRRRRRPAATRAATPADGRAARPPSDHTTDDADGDRRGGQHDPVARPQADRPAGDEHGAGRAADGQLAPPAVATAAAAAACVDRRRRSVEASAASAVEHGADAAGQRQQPDRGADDRRLDAPAVGPAAGDAGDDAVGAARDAQDARGAAHHRIVAQRRRSTASGSSRLRRRQGSTRDIPDGAATAASVPSEPWTSPRRRPTAAPLPDPPPAAELRPPQPRSSAASPRCSPTASASTRCGSASPSSCWRSPAASACSCTAALWLVLVVGQAPGAVGPRRRRGRCSWSACRSS